MTQVDVESWVISTTTCCLILKVISQNKARSFVFCTDAAGG